MTDSSKCPSPENGQMDLSNDPFLSVFFTKTNNFDRFFQKSSVKVSVNGYFHSLMIRFGMSVDGLSDRYTILVRLLLSVDKLSEGDCIFGPFFVVRRQTI